MHIFFNTALIYLFPLFMIYRLVLAWGVNIYFIWVMYAFAFFYGAYSYSQIKNHQSFKRLFRNWIIYLILTGAFMFFSNVPFKCFTNELYMFILPMMFVFIGMYDSDKEFYKWYVYSTAFCIVVGLMLFVMRPNWYLEFIKNSIEQSWYAGDIGDADTYVSYMRFSSFFPTSYAVSFFSSFSLCIIICDFFKEKKDALFNSRTLQIILLSICYIGALLCRMRVAMLFPIIMAAFCFAGGTVKGKKGSGQFFVSVLLFVVGISYYIGTITNNNIFSFVVEDVENRFNEMSFGHAMNESRTGQVDMVIHSWNNYLLGDGLGSKSGTARGLGFVGITDGNYVKMLVENGIVGVFLFAVIIIKTLKRCLGRGFTSSVEFWVILYMLFAMTGSNGLCIEFYYSIPFWFAIGRVWSNHLTVKQLNTISK